MKRAIVLILAALLLLLGSCGVLPDFSSDQSGTGTPAATQTPEAIKSIDAAVKGAKVVSGEAGEESLTALQQGEVVVSESVSAELDSPSNANAYFYVELEPEFGLGADFEYEEKHYLEWWNTPELEAYNEAYQIWLTDVFPALDEEMRAAEERGEEQAQGWGERNPQDYFDVYYEHNQSEEVVTAWKAAREKALEAQEAYEAWSSTDEYYETVYSLLLSEAERLTEEDYLVENYQWLIRGYLTKDQIENFDCGEYGYFISWAEK